MNWIDFKISVKRWIKTIKSSSRINAVRMFTETYNNEPYKNQGMKLALLYGKMYFYVTPIDGKGSLDYQARSREIDRLYKQFTRPTDRLVHIDDLRKLKKDVERANINGFFSVGQDFEQNKIEAERYDKAMEYLDSMIICCTLYPKLWKRQFLK